MVDVQFEFSDLSMGGSSAPRVRGRMDEGAKTWINEQAGGDITRHHYLLFDAAMKRWKKDGWPTDPIVVRREDFI
jgi:hypothetical protein